MASNGQDTRQANANADFLDKLAAAAEAEQGTKGHDARSRAFCSPESVANMRAHAAQIRRG